MAPETAARARFKKANALRPPERDFTISYCEIAGQKFVLQVTISKDVLVVEGRRTTKVPQPGQVGGGGVRGVFSGHKTLGRVTSGGKRLTDLRLRES